MRNRSYKHRNIEHADIEGIMAGEDIDNCKIKVCMGHTQNQATQA